MKKLDSFGFRSERGRSPMTQTAYFVLSWVILAALLYLPVCRLIWVLGVRRLEHRQRRRLEAEERDAQLRRARATSMLVVIAFSLLFNLQVVGLPGG